MATVLERLLRRECMCRNLCAELGGKGGGRGIAEMGNQVEDTEGQAIFIYGILRCPTVDIVRPWGSERSRRLVLHDQTSVCSVCL